MSTDVVTQARPGAGAHTPTFFSLLRAELLRVRSRRLVKLLVVALFALFALVAVVNFTHSAKPTKAQIDRAVVACPQPAVEGSPRAVAPAGSGPRCTVAEASSHGAFAKPPALRADIPDNVLGVGLGVAVMAFIIGCTVGGADWSQKTMAALLFWEPRRVRVFGAKLLALAIWLVALLAVAEAVWLVVNAVLVSTHGVWSDGSPSITQDLVTNLGRSLVLVLSMGGLAYGIASLTRNTGAALGAGFVYFAVAELFLRALWSRVEPFLLTTNIGALFTPGGQTYVVGGVEHTVSSVQGGVVLALYAVVVCGIGLELFRRRDVT